MTAPTLDPLLRHDGPAAKPNSVYRYYDRAGRLIYVGITSRGIQRQHEHSHLSDWWPHVTRQDIEHYPSQAEAARIERELIRMHRPPFNKVHNGEWSPLRDAYRRIVAAEREYDALVTGGLVEQTQCQQAVRQRASAVAAWLSGGDEDDSYDQCPQCGELDCAYGMGWHDASPDAWKNGYDAGKYRAESEAERRYAPAWMAARALQVAVDHGVRSGVVIPIGDLWPLTVAPAPDPWS